MTSYGRRCEVYRVWRQEFLDYCQNALNRISSWMTANLLTLNSSKTEFLLIGVSKHLAKIHKSSLNTTHSARNLGFIFDKHLIFSDQISSVSKSCYYHNCQLCCIRPYLDSTTVDSPPFEIALAPTDFGTRYGDIRDGWIMRLCARIILRIIGDLAHNWASPA